MAFYQSVSDQLEEITGPVFTALSEKSDREIGETCSELRKHTEARLMNLARRAEILKEGKEAELKIFKDRYNEELEYVGELHTKFEQISGKLASSWEEWSDQRITNGDC